MADGDPDPGDDRPGDGSDAADGDAEGDVLDQFEIGDTVGTTDDATNGHRQAATDTAETGTDADASPSTRPGESPAAGADTGPGAAGSETAGIDPSAFEGDGAAFSEVQRLRQRWLWGIVLGVSLAFVVTWLLRPTGSLLTVLLLGLPAVGIVATYAARLETFVQADGVAVRFFPLHRERRVVGYDEIVGVERRSFDAFGDFGGIGIRRTRSTWAYITGSGEGVVLERVDEPDVLVGTERPADLQRAVEIGQSVSRGEDVGLDERWRAVANIDASERIDG